MRTLEMYHYYLGFVLSDLYEMTDRGFKGSYPFMLAILHIIHLIHNIVLCNPSSTSLPERGQLAEALFWFDTLKIIPSALTILSRFRRTVLDGIPYYVEVSTYLLSKPHMTQKTYPGQEVASYCINVNTILLEALAGIMRELKINWADNDYSIDNKDLIGKLIHLRGSK